MANMALGIAPLMEIVLGLAATAIGVLLFGIPHDEIGDTTKKN